jgi:NitT/TauT family transport system permease protein
VSDFSFQRIWGRATALFYRPRTGRLMDVVVIVGVLGLLVGLITLAQEWTHSAKPGVPAPIYLSPWYLPGYAFFSLSRGLIAYALSLLFTLAYGYWAAKDALAEKILIPLLDILQSIPVLAFLPGVFLALQGLFPGSNVGLELAAIIMIFTGQAWNMTFSFYHSLKSVPADQFEVAQVYGFSWWQRFKWVELPFSTTGLVWNSMMSMAGGWFFLMICEAFKLQDQEVRLPGLGSYMTAAVEQMDSQGYGPMIWAILAMILMIVLLDQFLWNPVVVWAQKFRVEEGASEEKPTSWFLDLLQRSRLLRLAGRWIRRAENPDVATAAPPGPAPGASAPDQPTSSRGGKPSPWPARVSVALFAVLLALLVVAVWKLVSLLLFGIPAFVDPDHPERCTYAQAGVTGAQWLWLLGLAGLTLGRVLLAVAVGTLWTVPVGLFIGLSPRLRQYLQPVIQVAASFPAPMLFPLVVLVLHGLGVTLGWGSIVLMLMGTQWYILFNVVAGAQAIPADLQEAAHSYRLSLWQRFRALYLPGIFPFLVTGWVTAAGGAWNASIVSEYVTVKNVDMAPAWGLGSAISLAVNPPADAAGGLAGGLVYDRLQAPNLPLLAAAVLVMAVMVVTFNRAVWRQMYELAARRFSLSK